MENNDWVSFVNMNSVRAEAAAAQLQDGKLLVTGGNNGSAALSSAEILTAEGWESNIPSLPMPIYGHCMVTVNSTTVMVIGGLQYSQISRKTFFFTIGEERWAEGPALKYKRRGHSCGIIRRNKDSQEMSIIVAGGYGGNDEPNDLSSVEILDEVSNEWQTGPELQFGIRFSQMVNYRNEGVVLIGGTTLTGSLDILYQLRHGGQDAVWTQMEQKLKTRRFWHSAFLVPDNIVDCS